MSKNSSTAEILNSLPKVPTHTPLSPEQQALRYVGEKISSIAERDSDLSERMRVIFRDRSLSDDRFQKQRFSSEVPSGVVKELKKIKKKHAGRDDAPIAEFKRIHEEASEVKNKTVQDFIRRSLAGVIGYLENVKKIIATEGVDSRGSVSNRISKFFGRFSASSASSSSATSSLASSLATTSSASKVSNTAQSASQVVDEYDGLDELLDAHEDDLPVYLRGSEYDLPSYLRGTSHDKGLNQSGKKPGSDTQPSSASSVKDEESKSRSK